MNLTPCLKITTITLGLLAAATALAARPAGQHPGPECACPALPVSTAPLHLSPSTIEALRFQIDEERMAGDLYLQLGERWKLGPFTNIPVAEARHQSILRELARRASAEPEGAVTAGRYRTSLVQARYDTLLARGQTSLPEALRVGALVEEQDIADLRTLSAATENPELKAALAALEQASRHHLRAFVRNLESRGIENGPQALDAKSGTNGVTPRL